MPVDPRLIGRHIRPMVPIPTETAPRLANLKPFSAVLFDVYGTMLISGAGDIATGEPRAEHDGALGELLRRYRIQLDAGSLVDRLRQAIANRHAIAREQGNEHPEVDIRDIWRQVLGEGRMRGPMEADRIEAFALEYELVVNPVCPMPGLKALLSACKEGGVTMGVISNAQFFTPTLLEYFLGASLVACGFSLVLVFYSWLEGCAKPSPAMFDQARLRLCRRSILPHRTLFVGNDMRNDILPARSVGFQTALFAGDRRSLRLRVHDKGCRDVHPDLVVTDLRQLIALYAHP